MDRLHRFAAHFVIVAFILCLLVGIPFAVSERGRAFINGEEIDAISSATVIIEAPSGEYVAFINVSAHPDSQKLAVWKDFFAGEEIPIIFEDIDCQVIAGDAGGLDMAQSLQSRLPENQMTLEVTGGTLLLSKAQVGRFDCLLMSEEYADMYDANVLYDREDIEVIRISGQSEGNSTAGDITAEAVL